jgi:hypothetical protein
VDAAVGMVRAAPAREFHANIDYDTLARAPEQGAVAQQLPARSVHGALGRRSGSDGRDLRSARPPGSHVGLTGDCPGSRAEGPRRGLGVRDRQ